MKFRMSLLARGEAPIKLQRLLALVLQSAWKMKDGCVTARHPFVTRLACVSCGTPH